MRPTTLGILIALAFASAAPAEEKPAASPSPAAEERVVKTDEEWRKELTPEQFEVLREKGTERPFTGAYWNEHAAGVFRCAGCGNELFSSSTKFESGTGWPSFWEPISARKVKAVSDGSHGMVRTEVMCARCDGHLGHVFEDGPKPTGLRYCINSASLKLEKKDARPK